MRARQHRSRSSAPGNVRRVEATQLGEEVGAYQHDGARHEEDVAHRVVLLLVELTRLDPRMRHAEPVDRKTDLEQNLGPVVVHELRPEDRGVRPVALLDQEPDRRRVEDDVVVAEQEEGRALDDLEHVVRDRRESLLLAEATHERSGHGTGHPGGGVDGGAGVEHQHGQGRVVRGTDRRRGSPRAMARRPW